MQLAHELEVFHPLTNLPAVPRVLRRGTAVELSTVLNHFRLLERISILVQSFQFQFDIMATSAAKSSSIAALMLVVAVLVGSCASGAYADGSGKVDLVNTCNDDAFIKFGDTVSCFLVKAGNVVGINLSFLQGLVGPLYITKSGVVYVITTAQLNGISLQLNSGVVFKIEIVCNGDCGLQILTIKVSVQTYVLGIPTGLPVIITLCAEAVVN